MREEQNHESKGIFGTAGAGTGKSTLILGRIDYLMTCGVNPNDIMVLSFTNAAADNIKEKNPNVHSMTIASMIHEIYSANFSGHELSSLDTIINSLDIYYPTTVGTQSPQQKVAVTFKRRCSRIIRNDANAFTDMNNFIEENYDDVIAILDTIHQTSLELEIIICYIVIYLVEAFIIKQYCSTLFVSRHAASIEWSTVLLLYGFLPN